jgi:hypothetical protein
MGTYEPMASRGWRGRAVRRLQRLADALEHEGEVEDAEIVETEEVDAADDVDVESFEPADYVDHSAPLVLSDGREARAAERAAAARRAEFRAVVREVYPTVAPAIVALAEGGFDADLDEWLTVARLLYDDVTHRVGGLSAEARERALRAAAAQALEAQARSSARLAGYADSEQDEPSTIEGDPPGIRIWEHYLCREAKLVRENLHGETLGNWLSALGELWSAASLLYRLDSEAVVATGAEFVDEPEPVEPEPAVPAPDTATPGRPATGTPTPATAGTAVAVRPEPTTTLEPPERERARIALKAALTRVEELALW